jgi:hypothetical protein
MDKLMALAMTIFVMIMGLVLGMIMVLIGDEQFRSGLFSRRKRVGKESAPCQEKGKEE